MVKIIIYTGLSLPFDEAKQILDSFDDVEVIYKRPIKRGDLNIALKEKPDIIGIIDGVFHQNSAVGHKEILAAIKSGIKMFGSSSMGALRASELDTLGRLKGVNVEPKFTHIPDWFAWEREQIKEEIENKTYVLDVPCDIAILKDPKALYMVGTGRLHHDVNGFVLDGCDGKLHYEQSPGASYSVNSDYFWYEIGDIVSIGTNDCLYFCFPKEGDIVAKTRLAAEELYKLSKGKASSES